MIRVFIGYDNNEKVAFSTLSHSLLKHSTQPIAITPIRLENIKDIFVRERLKIQSTEFIFDAEHGEGFCIGNIIKYAQRYGKKQGRNQDDLLKIIHYAIILLGNDIGSKK